MKKLLFLMLLFINGLSHAQFTAFGTRPWDFINTKTKPWFKYNEFKGYLYLERIKNDPKVFAYKINILTPELAEQASAKIEFDEDYVVTDVFYNDSIYCFSVYKKHFRVVTDGRGGYTTVEDQDKIILFYDQGGKQLASYPIGINKALFEIAPVQNKGFIMCKWLIKKSLTLCVFFENNGNVKWTKPYCKKNGSCGENIFLVMDLTPGKIAYKRLHGESPRTNNIFFSVLSEEGEKLIDIPAFDDEFYYNFCSIKFNQDKNTYTLKGQLCLNENTVIKQYFDTPDFDYEPWKGQIGSFQLEINMEGEITDRKIDRYSKSTANQLYSLVPEYNGKAVYYKYITQLDNGNSITLARFYEGLNKKDGERDSLKSKFLKIYDGVLFETDINTGKVLGTIPVKLNESGPTEMLAMGGWKEERLITRVIDQYIRNMIKSSPSSEENSCILINSHAEDGNWPVYHYTTSGKVKMGHCKAESKDLFKCIQAGKPGVICIYYGNSGPIQIVQEYE